MTEAIFGLVGVLIGGIISGGATYLMARRSERRAARSAARLLENDLRGIAGALGAYVTLMKNLALDEGPLTFTEDTAPEVMRKDSWAEHRPLLAEVLDSDDWYALSQAFLWIRKIQGKWEPAFTGEGKQSKRRLQLSAEEIQRGIDNVGGAIRAVERIAGGKPETYWS